MRETKINKLSMDIEKNSKKIYSRVIDPAFQRIFTQLPQKLHNSIQSRINRSAKDGVRTKTETSSLEQEKGLSNSFEVDLEKQLQAWRDNPVWVDQPAEIRVNVPKGSFCHLNVKVNVGLPPDAVYNIVTDPDNKRVFKNIKEVTSRKVLVDEGSRQVVEVEQAALWRFLWWSGTISVHVLVDQNREDYSMKFNQVKTGFMKKFEGRWKVEPLFVDKESCFPLKPTTLSDYHTCTGGKGRIGSQVSLDQLIQPAIVPPPPISWYLRGITTKTTEMLINDLIAEAANIRGCASGTKYSEPALDQCQDQSEGISDEWQLNENRDIKERWAMHRIDSRKCRQRLHRVSKST